MSESLLLVECNTDASAAAELGISAIATGGRDLSDAQIEDLGNSPGVIYVLPDADNLDKETLHRWVRALYPKALLCPAEYGEGLEDLSDVLHKRGSPAALEVLEGLKARGVDALELELREAEERSEGSQSLPTYRRAKERILPLLLR